MGASLYNFKKLLFILVVWLAYSIDTFAQIQELTIGQQVKVTASSVSDDEIIGTVTELSDTLIKIQVSDRGSFRPGQVYTAPSSDNESIINVPVSNIQSLAIRGGETRGNAGKGAVFGGISLGLLTLGSCSSICAGPKALLVGGAVGAGVGALIGAMIRTPVWEEVPVQVSMGLVPNRSSNFAANPSISLRFSL